MTTQAIIDIEALLAPISEEQPTGSDLREETSATSAYYLIKDARNSARAAERNNMFDTHNSEANDNWKKISQLAPQILTSEAKDLEIASWYTEALVRQHGFAGLRDGFQLIHQLIERYWDNLYPMPDEDGVETRVSSLTGLNGEGAEGVLIAPIRNIDITEGDEPGPFNYWRYQQALDIQKISDEKARSEKIAKLGFTLEDVEQAVAESSESFYVGIRADIQACIDAFSAIGQLLDQHCGSQDSPPVSNIVHVLEDCRSAVNHLGKHKFPVAESSEDSSESETGNVTSTTSKIASGPVKTREDAFRQLSEISEFFRKTEPHSPISYILQKAVKWGNMSLAELMQELIPDNSSREYYGSLTGIKTDDN